MAARVILLDLDGTVWDSYPWYGRVLERTGLIRSAEVESALRRGLSIIRVARDVGVSRSRLLRLIRDASEAIPIYPGVETSLETLAGRGVKLGIVTSLSGAIALPMLAKAAINDFFDTVVHPGNCRAYKPAARPILVALEALGEAASSSVVYVGDQEADAAAAHNAEIRFAWASFGYGTRTPSAGETILTEFGDVAEL